MEEIDLCSLIKNMHVVDVKQKMHMALYIIIANFGPADPGSTRPVPTSLQCYSIFYQTVGASLIEILEGGYASFN